MALVSVESHWVDTTILWTSRTEFRGFSGPSRGRTWTAPQTASRLAARRVLVLAYKRRVRGR